MIDKAKLVVAVALVALGVWGYYWLADSALVLRVLAVVAGLLAAGAVAWWSDQAQYLVTTSVTTLGRGRVAGVFQNCLLYTSDAADE